MNRRANRYSRSTELTCAKRARPAGMPANAPVCRYNQKNNRETR
jgi:hypothetical protein